MLILKDDNRAMDEPKVLFIQTNLCFGTLQTGQPVLDTFIARSDGDRYPWSTV